MPNQPKPGSPVTKKQQREAIRMKYNNRCAYCGCELTKGWHVDHVEPCRRIMKSEYIPQREGVNEMGRWVDKLVGYSNPDANHIDNYIPSCASCNINKHSDSLEGFRKNIAAYMKHLNEISTQYKIAKRYGLIIETGKPVVFYFETLNTNDHE